MFIITKQVLADGKWINIATTTRRTDQALADYLQEETNGAAIRATDQVFGMQKQGSMRIRVLEVEVKHPATIYGY